MKAAILTFVAFLAIAFFYLMYSQKGKTGEPVITEVSTRTQTAPEAPRLMTTIQWIDSVKTLGKITEGENIEISYRFKNTGTNMLVINSVLASCGCTVAEKPEKPVPPGKEGIIKASFNSNGRVGNNHKTISVYTNTQEGTHTLVFDVEVTEAKN
jgi:hypothetical protein